MGRISRWIRSLCSKSSKHSATKPQRIAREVELASRSSFDGYGRVDYQHAEAVAAATATAAEAAVVAALAAGEVVRLARSGRFDFDLRRRAAVAIQSAFRAHLARRALRALRSLVKLQALVRGYIVRKRIAEQMRRMHALITAQVRSRAIRASVPAYSLRNDSKQNSKTHSGRYSYQHFDEEKMYKTVEVDSTNPHASTKRNSLFLISDTVKDSDPPWTRPIPNSPEILQDCIYSADGSPRPHTGSSRREGYFAPVDYSESYLGAYPDNIPNYMCYTRSSRAKFRSLSAPKQRSQLERSTSLRCYCTGDCRTFSPSNMY